ncbi:MAG: transporter [Thiohalomonadales bacterium]
MKIYSYFHYSYSLFTTSKGFPVASYKIIFLQLVTFGLIFCKFSQAQELEPRSYINIPVDQNFIALVYVYSEGDINTSPDVPIENLTLRNDGPIMAYVRTFAMFDHSAKIDISVGHACALGKAKFNGTNVSRGFCGITDTRVRLNYNFYGAPALDLQNYVTHKKEIVIGTSFQVNIPTGEYDTQYIFNIGSNRWYVKPEIGMSIPVNNWEIDFSLGVKIFSENNEFQRTSTLRQDPIYNFQTHLIYDITRSQWLALDLNYFEGGDTYLNGKNTSQTRGNYRSGLTYSYAFNSHHSIKLLANTGVTTRLGNDSKAYGVGWSYRWQ